MRVARSLLAFVGIGIVSGLALGIYLLDARSITHTGALDSPAVQIEGPAISIIPSKMSFDLGEQVTFRIVNTGTVPLHSEDGMFGSTITGLSGIPIYTFGIQDIAAHGANLAHADGQEAPMSTQSTQSSEQAPGGMSWILLLPGDEIQISWDQTRHDGESVQAGLYKASIRADVISEAMASAIAAAATAATAVAAAASTAAAANATAGDSPGGSQATSPQEPGAAHARETIDNSVTITVQ